MPAKTDAKKFLTASS